ncbi:MAG: molybdopterin-dependent oxidoreductase [Deltaproteobacteria bacterium]|nr:molybdopterin-dependent oxidoreductase [Deltaproteobacteria bacterium]
MTIKKIKTSCSMDCFDACSLIATVSDGKVISIEGDKSHPLTKGFCCHKGKKTFERMYHSERLKKPLRKMGDRFFEITWDEAFSEIEEKLKTTINEYGSESILLYSGYGYSGILKNADRMFFNYLGGVSVHKGSLCMGAGVAAQTYDFGETLSNAPDDCLNSKTIVIWGRNPAITNIHLYSNIKKASKNGTKIVTIDPLKTMTANKSDLHIRVKPGTDGALALGISAELIRSGFEDVNFLKNHTKGYEEFKSYTLSFSLSKTSEITGIDENTIKNLAKTYFEKPVATYIGFGMQRYENGGNNVRCIDALAAVSGNIGIKGGGANYGHIIDQLIDCEYTKSKIYGVNTKYYNISRIPDFINDAKPAIQCMFISKANPMVQNPDINAFRQSLKKVPFKVVTDMFMTDTAKLADIVLPCTSVLEEEDLIYSSMFTPYLNHAAKAVEPMDDIISEYNFYIKLAKMMNIKDYPNISETEFLKRAVKPVCDYHRIDFEDIRDGYFSPSDDIAWENMSFATPSKKFEFYSEKAEEDGLNPVAKYIKKQKDSKYPYRLITPHSKKSLHSQHYHFLEDHQILFINSKIMETLKLSEDSKVLLSSKKGALKVMVKPDNNLDDDTIMMYQGFRNEKGSVNVLTSGETSDMGEQTCFYDCFCNISKIEI